MKLRGFEQRWADAVGAALLPAGACGGARAGFSFGPELERQLGEAPWWTALAVRLGLWMVWFSPVWQLRRRATFGALHAPEREALLEELLRHPRYTVRESANVIKLFLCLAFLGDPKVLRRVHAYDLEDRP